MTSARAGLVGPEEPNHPDAVGSIPAAPRPLVKASAVTHLPLLVAILGWVAAVVLVLAGAAKLRAPGGTADALRAARLPAAPALVRLLGAAEVGIGVAVLAAGGPVPAVAAAVLYAAFTAFVLRQRGEAGAVCGCFGTDRTLVTDTHVVVNAVATVVLAANAAMSAAPVARLTSGDPPVASVATAVLVVVAAWSIRLALTAGAELSAAVALHPRREVAS